MSADDTSSALADYYARQNLEAPGSLDHFWMPFTANRQFKKAPRLLASASGMYYTTVDGRKLLDAAAGLWCVNIGYGRKDLAEVAYKQMLELPYYNTFFGTTTPPAVLLATTAARSAALSLMMRMLFMRRPRVLLAVGSQ